MYIQNFVKPEPSPKMTTMAIGEEGGHVDPYPITTQSTRESGEVSPPRATTKALGEEGGGYPNPPQASSMATWEEGGCHPTPPPDVTTFAIGEEGGGHPNPPQASSMATWEEGGCHPTPHPRPHCPGHEHGGSGNNDSFLLALLLLFSQYFSNGNGFRY